MARVSSPVTIITAVIDGQPTGTTVSSFASLSIDPPMVFFALDNRGAMIERTHRAGRIGINILAGDQSEIALRFARRGVEDRFAGIDWRLDNGLPHIAGVASWLQSDHLTFEPGGDHTLVLAKISHAETYGDSSLGYHLRQFRDVRPQLREVPPLPTVANG